MTARLLALAGLLSLTVVTARAADDDHPYKAAKVGDAVTYKATIKAFGQTVEGTAVQTVTAKTDKEATVEMKVKAGGFEQPPIKQTIDLTKPFDPASTVGLPPGIDLKVEKLKDGKEKVTVNKKEYDAAWATYKMTGKVNGQDVAAEAKTWTAKGVPFAVLKTELTVAGAGQKAEITTEFREATTGKAKD